MYSWILHFRKEALDELMYLSDGFKVFCLKPPNSEKTIKTLTSERKGKLLDREMISIDLVKVRFFYNATQSLFTGVHTFYVNLCCY